VRRRTSSRHCGAAYIRRTHRRRCSDTGTAANAGGRRHDSRCMRK
jgi:hypothetical protein